MVHSPNKKGNCIVPIGCWAVRRLRDLIFIWWLSPTPLKNMKVSSDYYSQWKNKNLPNHQSLFAWDMLGSVHQKN